MDGESEVKNARDEKEEDEDEEADSPIPIDRGWAWMVVAGCFGMHVLVVGGVKSFGVLFVELQQLYDVSAKQLGVVHGLASVLMMALGPVSNALSVRYSCRSVVFAGGLLISCGFVSSAFVPSFNWLYLTYSILTGLGAALAYAPSVVLVGHHFTRRRALANGISVSGSAVGSFLLPNLMQHLLNQYGLRGAFALIGALMLHVCLCAVFFRPLSSYKRRPRRRSTRRCAPHEEECSGRSLAGEEGVAGRAPEEEACKRASEEEEELGSPTTSDEEGTDDLTNDPEAVSDGRFQCDRDEGSCSDLLPKREHSSLRDADENLDLEGVADAKSQDPGREEDTQISSNLRRAEDHQQGSVVNRCPRLRDLLLSASVDVESSADVSTNTIRSSLEKKLCRNASLNSMTTQFGSFKQKGGNRDRTGSFKLHFRRDSSKSKTSGSVKRQAFKTGRPILERHPSALWDTRLPESLKQAIEEEERRRLQRGESIELLLLDKNSAKQEAGGTATLERKGSKHEQSKTTGRRFGSFKAIDVANPIKFMHERKKLLLASNVRYMSETRDVGVASPSRVANEKAPLKRFYSVEAGHQASPPLNESFLHRRIRQISEADSWRSESSVFASAGDLALASLQNIVVSAKEVQEDALSNTSRGSGLKAIFRLSAQTVHKGERKKTSVPLFDLSLMLNPVFLVFFLSLVCMNFGYPNIFVMLPSFCQEVGLDKTTAAFMVSIIGLTDLVGRIFIGWFSDLRLFPRKYGFMVSLAVAGLLCTMLPRMKTFQGLVAFSCGFGFCGGCFIALIAVILVDFLGKERLASSFGLASVAMAVGIMAGPAIYGDIRDTVGSWDVAFVVSGLMSLAAASCIFMEPLARHMLNRPIKASEPPVRDEML